MRILVRPYGNALLTAAEGGLAPMAEMGPGLRAREGIDLETKVGCGAARRAWFETRLLAAPHHDVRLSIALRNRTSSPACAGAGSEESRNAAVSKDASRAGPSHP